ncbi:MULTISPECIES: beta-1,6-N-acetylglucosaminyltransferase [Oligella]|uniref:beta-1,6-N-acetylglucosaminyltransferase n=1 Tax=Oligella TaxID=90243 RepID=UPI000362E682|nr:MULTISPECIES: beta-1,6-N-acetylglucosaminyltransferase [Oligella]OFV45931.1 conjugal transfer protein [Oligella sp. HMSC09E12]SUA66520.1 Core-2/I-Branching enzyme [Oligella urethralis]
MKKKCFLVLTHKPIDKLLEYARNHPNDNFYIHLDLKKPLEKLSVKGCPNVFFIDKRVDVKWAGFSMVQATLNLISFALKHDSENEFFHLISGDDVILNENLSWSDDSIYMEYRESKRHNYRMRFDVPHADNKYTRHPLGKIYTQVIKLFDKFLPSHRLFKFGSQWFSIRRAELLTLYESISVEDISFFKKKLCPDEHFFQYLVEKNKLSSKVSTEGNKRFIVFNPSYQRGSSPVFLSLSELKTSSQVGYWFARKVDQATMEVFYDNDLRESSEIS